MKFIIALATTLTLIIAPVYAKEPVKKSNGLMLAKKKDHSKAAEAKPAKKQAKKSNNKK